MTLSYGPTYVNGISILHREADHARVPAVPTVYGFPSPTVQFRDLLP